MFQPNDPSRERRFGLINQGRPHQLGGKQTGYDAQGRLREEEFYVVLACGHSGHVEPGGACAVCQGIACKTCLVLCTSCGHALCPRHTTRLDGQPLCVACLRSAKASGAATGFVKSILSVFINFETPKDQKRGFLDWLG